MFSMTIYGRMCTFRCPVFIQCHWLCMSHRNPICSGHFLYEYCLRHVLNKIMPQVANKYTTCVLTCLLCKSHTVSSLCVNLSSLWFWLYYINYAIHKHEQYIWQSTKSSGTRHPSPKRNNVNDMWLTLRPSGSVTKVHVSMMQSRWGEGGGGRCWISYNIPGDI